MSFPRRFFICVFACCVLASLAAQQLPAPQGYVNDFAGVMKPEDVQAAENLAAAVRQKTGAEIALVTVENYAPYASIDEFTLALAESWGVGEKGKDTGVLLVLAVSEREVRIEVGYGLEGAIPDSAAGRILDAAVIPAFRAGDFSGGLAAGAQAIAFYIAKEYGIDPAELHISAAAPQAEEGERPGIGSILAVLFFLFLFRKPLFALLFLSGMGGRRGGGFGGSFRGGGGFRGFGGGGFGGGGASRRF